MKFHTEYLTFRTKKHREYIHLTPRIEDIVNKSGIKEGMVLVSAMHITAGVYVNDDEPGLIEDIDAWVTAQAIELIDREGRAGRDLRLEINLSGRTLGSSRLTQAIEARIAETSIDPASLIFEVTETAAVVNMEEAKEFASALASLGCRFALDDFGAGFGSFYYLKYLPLDYLKIDGDFIAHLGRNPTDQAVVKAIVELARQLDMATIAEFVGDQRTIALLREYGVDHVQGYHVGTPQPVDELWSDVEVVPVRGS